MFSLQERSKTDPGIRADEFLCHTEVVRTMLVVLSLGYSVVVSYVIEPDDIPMYERPLRDCGVPHKVLVLAPTREACLERDRNRPFWTAGEEFVDRWHPRFRSMLQSSTHLCVDNSDNTVAETVKKYLQPWIQGN